MHETLRRALEAGAKKLAADLRDPEHPDPRFPKGCQLYLLLWYTYMGWLDPCDWDVGYYLHWTIVPEVKRALMEMLEPVQG